MNILDSYKGNYLAAADISNKQPYTVNMLDVVQAVIGDAKEIKNVLNLQGLEQGLVLNKTNAQAIVDLYGPETSSWAGKNIALVVRIVEFGGKSVPAIRIEAVQITPVTQLQQAAVTQEDISM